MPPRENDSSLIEEIYRLYAKPVKFYSLSLCHSEDAAEDITAETFLKAVKNIDSFKGGNVLAWLCTIAKNTYLDFSKKKSASALPLTDEMLLSIKDNRPVPEEALALRDDKIFLYALLQKLDPGAREVVYLRMFTDLSFKEIGSILGKSENWARVVFYRSKNKLKGLIKSEN